MPRGKGHIVLLTPGFPENERDDICIPALQDYVAAFARAHEEVRVTVLALHYPPRTARYRWRGADVIAVGKGAPAAKPLGWIRALRHIRSAHRAAPVTMLHSFWYGECAGIGAAASAWLGIPHCCTLMGREMISPNRYAGLIPARGTRVVAPSEPLAGDFLRKTGRRVDAVIPWGVDLADAPGAQREIDIFGAGSLSTAKNYEEFLVTAAALAVRRPNLRCVLAGDGPGRGRLEEMAGTLGLDRILEFTGALPRADILDYMRKSRVLLHTSRYEGFGHVFAEALASGMRVASYHVGCAQPHPRWHIAADAAELVAFAEAALDAPAGPPPGDIRSPFPISATIARYAALYGLGEGGTR